MSALLLWNLEHFIVYIKFATAYIYLDCACKNNWVSRKGLVILILHRTK